MMLSFSRSFGLLLLLFLAAAPSVIADEASDADYEESYYNQFSVCEESTVLVKDISIMCDSPGAYYYGSGKYRNSASCQAGDKSNLYIDLVILQDLEDDAFLTLTVKGYGSVESVYLYDQESLCDAVQSTNGAECPSAGYYAMSERFYWGSQSDSYEYSFVPEVVVGIASGANQKYDLGGANTNQCYSGNTFTDWTAGVRKSAADSFVTFMLTFGSLLAVLIVIGLVGYFLIKQANKRRQPKKEVIVDEEFDEASYLAVRDHKTLVDPSLF